MCNERVGTVGSLFERVEELEGGRQRSVEQWLRDLRRALESARHGGPGEIVRAVEEMTRARRAERGEEEE